MGKFKSIIVQAVIAAVLVVAFGPAGGALFTEGIFAGFSSIQAGILTAVGSLALGAVNMALAPKPETPNFASFQAEAQGRTQQLKQPIVPWSIVYGEVIKAGVLSYAESTSNNTNLHFVLTLASHACESIESYYLDEVVIYPSQLDANGLVTTGKFKNKVQFQPNLGTTGSQPFPDLVAASSFWTDAHRQEGKTKLYVKMIFDKSVFPQGVPNIKVRLRGKKVWDPRDSSTTWQPNPALAINDYFIYPTTSGGFGGLQSEVDNTTLVASANNSDEFVDTLDLVHQVDNVATDTDIFELTGAEDSIIDFQMGDRVQLTTTDTEPTGVSLLTNYYIILVREKTNDVLKMAVKLATSYDNAILGTAINITGAGSGAHTLTKNGEPRYTASGVILTDRIPLDILQDLRVSMAARILPIGGKWFFKSGAWTSPTVTLDEDDLRGPISFSTKQSRRERFNAIQGIYISLRNSGQPTSYPIVVNTSAETSDGERIFRTLDLPFSNRAQTCQRISKIEIERARRELTVNLKCNLAAFQVQAIDTVAITNARYGWSAKSFEIAEWHLVLEGTPPVLGVDLVLREADSTIFDFAESTEETQPDPPTSSNLPDPSIVVSPGAPAIAEALYNARGGGGVKAKATGTWEASTDGFLYNYEPAFKLSSSSEWIELAPTQELTSEVLDIIPGIYDFRVVAVNTIGNRSDASLTLNKEIQGLGAAPSAITNLTATQVSSLALLEWDLHPDLDVQQGGCLKFRHTPELVTPAIRGSTRVGKANGYPGLSTQVYLPLRTGTYFIVPYDALGISGTPTTVTLTAARLLTFTTATTITESPLFLGTHTSTLVSGSTLRLAGAGLFDAIPDLDLMTDNIDVYGGISSEGTYEFNSVMDLGSVKDVRLTATLQATIIDSLDNMDSWTANVDDRANWDGVGGTEADAQVFVKTTDDDPSASPTWSTAWQILTIGDFSNRGFKYKCVLTSFNNVYNIHVDTLSVEAEELV